MKIGNKDVMILVFFVVSVVSVVLLLFGIAEADAGIVWDFDESITPLYKSLRAILSLSKMAAALAAAIGTAWCAFEWVAGENRSKSYWLSWMLALYMTLGSTIIVDAVLAVTVGKVGANAIKAPSFEGINSSLPKREIARYLS